MECKLTIVSTKNQNMLYDSLGASDIFVMNMSIISAK